jgi:hypothetical protein
MSDIGVVYITRGVDPNWRARLTRFITSYLKYHGGAEHRLYVIYKEFSPDDLLWARHQLADLDHEPIFDYLEHNSFGGGCFQEACAHVTEPLLCTLVSTTEIMQPVWLHRLYNVFLWHKAGLVGCTGSKEANLHIRDTAILIRRSQYLEISKQFDFTKSKEGYLDFEHGPNNLTIQVMRANRPVFVVEKERVLAPDAWGHTTYRGNLENVLVHDRGARDFQDL